MKRALLLLAIGTLYIYSVAMQPTHVYNSRVTQILTEWLKNYDWIKKFNTPEIRQLIMDGADPNAEVKNKTLLTIASDDPDMISFLLKYGANPTADSLANAMFVGNLTTVKLLIAHGANIHEKDIQGNTPLMRAVISNNLNMVELLLELGAAADIEVANRSGWTPLYYARNSHHRNKKMVELLESYKKQKL